MRSFGTLGIGTLVLFSASLAFGADGEPKKANKYQSTTVNAYSACTAPSETTLGGLPLPACPAVDADATCNFGDKGKGKIQAKAKDDVSLSVKLGGLENCDGETLQAIVTIAATTNNCSVSTRCSTPEITLPIPGATCVVDKGKCKIKTTVNTLIPGAITPGQNTSIVIRDVTLGRTTGTAAGIVTEAGLLVP